MITKIYHVIIINIIQTINSHLYRNLYFPVLEYVHRSGSNGPNWMKWTEGTKLDRIGLNRTELYCMD